MNESKIRIRAALMASTGALALALVAAPLQLNPKTMAPAYSMAFAKGGGGGGGGGHGGGHGNGVGGGADKADGKAVKGPDDARATRATKEDESAGGTKGKATQAETNSGAKSNIAAKLGNLNAAHASPTARAHASANSMVGRIAAYERTMKEAQAIDDPAQHAAKVAEARTMLEATANKPVTDDVVGRVNGLLGLDTTSSTPTSNGATAGQ